MRMKLRPLPSREELLATFTYDPESGLLRWKSPGKKRRVGDIAGRRMKSGHIALFSRDKSIYAHRAIWKMVFGTEPPEIDHWDNDPSNNRLGNLRASDRAGNNRNQRKLKPGTSRFKGVYWCKQKAAWHARIMVNRHYRHLGFFQIEEEASAAYSRAAPLYHGQFANDGHRSLSREAA